MPTPLRSLRALLALSLALAGCSSTTDAVASPTRPAAHSVVIVFAAASLADVFREVGEAFEELHPQVVVAFNFASSEQLAGQILLGAPGDVFASASPRQMQTVVEAGLAHPEDVRTFAGNRLVVVVPAANPAGLERIQDLARPGVRVILAVPEAPAGAYALEFLSLAGQDPSFGADFPQEVQANVVSLEENVRAVLAKVVLGEADAGIVYITDATSAEGRVLPLAIPPELNVLAEFQVAPLAAGEPFREAQAFVDFVLSEEAQAILASHGFLTAAEFGAQDG